MKIRLNGEELELDRAECTVRELLRAQEIDDSFIAVAVNLSCVPRSRYEETRVRDGDSVEILSPMQGG